MMDATLTSRHAAIPAPLAVALGCFGVIVLLPLFWVAGADVLPELRFLGLAMILCAVVMLRLRGATGLSPATWIVILCAYPLLTPLLATDLLGFEVFATGDRAHQAAENWTVPFLVGAAACLALSCLLSVQSISVPQFARVQTLKGTTAFGLLLGSSVMLLGSNFLDAPLDSLQLGRASYSDIKAGRDNTLNAASGLVICFGAASALALALVRQALDLGASLKRAATLLFVLLTAAVVVWQTLAASRIETVGLLLLLYLMFGHLVAAPIRAICILVTVSVMGFIGYFRTLAGLLAYITRDFFSWPGGVENVMNTYVFGASAIRDGTISLQLGQTYLSTLERLPPQVLGLARPPRAYDLLASETRLIGGEYFLMEPFLNFLGFGVLAAVLLLAWAVNRAIETARRGFELGFGFAVTLIALVLFTVCFRLVWYGLEHSLKALILAALLSIPLALLDLAYRRRSTP